GLQLQVVAQRQLDQLVGIILRGHRQAQRFGGRPARVLAAQAKQGVERQPLAHRLGAGAGGGDAGLAGKGLFLAQLQLADVAGTVEALGQVGRGLRAFRYRLAHAGHLFGGGGAVPGGLDVEGQVEHGLRQAQAGALVFAFGQAGLQRRGDQVAQRQRQAGQAYGAIARADFLAANGNDRVADLHRGQHLGALEAEFGIGQLQLRTAQQGDAGGALERQRFGQPAGHRIDGFGRGQGGTTAGFQQRADVFIRRPWRQRGAAGQDGQQARRQHGAGREREHVATPSRAPLKGTGRSADRNDGAADPRGSLQAMGGRRGVAATPAGTLAEASGAGVEAGVGAGSISGSPSTAASWLMQGQSQPGRSALPQQSSAGSGAGSGLPWQGGNSGPASAAAACAAGTWSAMATPGIPPATRARASRARSSSGSQGMRGVYAFSR